MPNLFLTTYFSFIILVIRVILRCFIGFKQPTHTLSRIALLVVHGMPVDVTGDLYGAMPKDVTHGLQRDALRDEYGGAAMPQVVEAYCYR